MKQFSFIAFITMIVLIGCKSNKEEKETLAPLFNLKSFFKKGKKIHFVFHQIISLVIVQITKAR